MSENLTVQQQIDEEILYLETCEKRFEYVEKVESEIIDKKESQIFLNDEEMLAYQFNPIEIDDLKIQIKLCQERIENLKKHGEIFPSL